MPLSAKAEQRKGDDLKIAILGSGAMGMLFGGYLSKYNEVMLIDLDKTKVDNINRDGIRIMEPDGTMTVAHPPAALSAEGLGCMDLVMIFVKAMHTRIALAANQRLVGPDSYVLSLQNGSGHDAVMKEFIPEENIVIGTTQHNSSIVEPGVVRHGGAGKTFIGVIHSNGKELQPIEKALNRCGFETEISDCIQRRIWEKLFLNASASALTAVLQTKLGFLVDSQNAWLLTERLVREAVAVANGDGMEFEEEKVVAAVRKQLENAKDGYTSIYADIREGRKTEVDTISGAVVSAGRRNHVPAPGHEFMVGLIHAMEDKRNL